MIDWRRFCVSPEASLIDALLAIDRGALGFALVVHHGTLVGLATDGDIRRALIRGVTTSAPIRLAMNEQPVVGRASERPAQWSTPGTARSRGITGQSSWPVDSDLVCGQSPSTCRSR